MDIYKYAKSIGYAADYMDYTSGYIYHIQEYGQAIKEDDTKTIDRGIRVSEDGRTIGYAHKL